MLFTLMKLCETMGEQAYAALQSSRNDVTNVGMELHRVESKVSTLLKERSTSSDDNALVQHQLREEVCGLQADKLRTELALKSAHEEMRLAEVMLSDAFTENKAARTASAVAEAALASVAGQHRELHWKMKRMTDTPAYVTARAKAHYTNAMPHPQDPTNANVQTHKEIGDQARLVAPPSPARGAAVAAKKEFQNLLCAVQSLPQIAMDVLSDEHSGSNSSGCVSESNLSAISASSRGTSETASMQAHKDSHQKEHRCFNSEQTCVQHLADTTDIDIELTQSLAQPAPMALVQETHASQLCGVDHSEKNGAVSASELAPELEKLAGATGNSCVSSSARGSPKRCRRQTLAVVTDDSGRITGIVTASDGTSAPAKPTTANSFEDASPDAKESVANPNEKVCCVETIVEDASPETAECVADTTEQVSITRTVVEDASAGAEMIVPYATEQVCRTPDTATPGAGSIGTPSSTTDTTAQRINVGSSIMADGTQGTLRNTQSTSQQCSSTQELRVDECVPMKSTDQQLQQLQQPPRQSCLSVSSSGNRGVPHVESAEKAPFSFWGLGTAVAGAFRAGETSCRVVERAGSTKGSGNSTATHTSTTTATCTPTPTAAATHTHTAMATHADTGTHDVHTNNMDSVHSSTELVAKSVSNTAECTSQATNECANNTGARTTQTPHGEPIPLVAEDDAQAVLDATEHGGTQGAQIITHPIDDTTVLHTRNTVGNDGHAIIAARNEPDNTATTATAECTTITTVTDDATSLQDAVRTDITETAIDADSTTTTTATTKSGINNATVATEGALEGGLHAAAVAANATHAEQGTTTATTTTATVRSSYHARDCQSQSGIDATARTSVEHASPNATSHATGHAAIEDRTPSIQGNTVQDGTQTIDIFTGSTCTGADTVVDDVGSESDGASTLVEYASNQIDYEFDNNGTPSNNDAGDTVERPGCDGEDAYTHMSENTMMDGVSVVRGQWSLYYTRNTPAEDNDVDSTDAFVG